MHLYNGRLFTLSLDAIIGSINNSEYLMQNITG